MNDLAALSLLDAYDAALELELMVRGVSLQDYLADRKLHLAAENLLIKAGEALSQARKRDEAVLDQMMSAYAVVGIRNFFIHEYQKVDEETVWSTAVSEVPLLRAELAYVLTNAGYALS